MNNNFKNIISNNFNPDIFNLISELNFYAKKSSVHLYFIGGLVRDLIMGSEVSDIDILVEGSAIEFCINCEICEIISIHNDFGTVKTRVKGFEIDFASTRCENYPQSGCLPLVSELAVPLQIDVKRRDFTVNAIALSLDDFSLVDYYDGVQDIAKKTLKILHKDSFIDDPTRILRGLDFSIRFGFEFDDYTKNALCLYLKEAQNLREGLSMSRVELTLDKVLLHGALAYSEIISKQYYKIFRDDAPQISYETISEASTIFNVPEAKLAKFALLTSIDAPEVDISSSYNIYLSFKKYTNLELAQFYIFNFYKKEIVKYFAQLKDIRLNLSGADLISLGYKQGKIIGEALNSLLEYRINSKNNLAKDEEIAYILRNFNK